LKERLEQEISEYNALIDQITEVRERLAQLEAERERRMGRVQLLNELVAAENDESEEPTEKKK
jgi:hypothetical protein